MAIAPPKNRLFENDRIPTDGGNLLHAKLMFPKPPMPPQRVVMIAPLVGASAGQQFMLFRDFSRRGAIVISYEYRGHPMSTGAFDLDKTVIDTHHALLWSLEYARRRDLPLHGFATCYGVIPLLAQFREGGSGQLLRSVTTISGLYNLHQILRVEDFAPIVSRHVGEELDADALVARIEDGRIDCNGLPLRTALREFLSALMPELRIELDSFEELRYDRIDMRQMLLQFARADYLAGVRVPSWMPCTAIVGRADHLLNAHTPEGRKLYDARVRSMLPQAATFDFDMDHYGRGPEHPQMIQCAGDAFERSDVSAVPPCHLAKVLQRDFRSLPR